MGSKIRIGTRESKLAMWQANYVKGALENNGIECTIVPIKSDGEIETTLPIYEIGVQGVFTKTLDIALLEERIDIAVHSLKDVPTKTPQGISIVSIPKRGNHRDVIVTRSPKDWSTIQAHIATSSIRRKAQWNYKFPGTTFDNIRGNINTRLQKLKDNQEWDGVIFAAAGIERIDLKVPHLEVLNWMLPAPAQGALGIAAREDDKKTIELCSKLNDHSTHITCQAERQFLRQLMGGCATPIAAYAEMKGQEILFKGNILTLGSSPKKKEINLKYTVDQAKDIGKLAAEEMLQKGGQEIIDEIRKSIG